MSSSVPLVNSAQVTVEHKVEFVETTGSYLQVFGHFRLWIGDKPIGNWEDLCMLSAVVRWMKDLVSHPTDRCENRLFFASNETVFSCIYDPLMVYKVTQQPPLFKIEATQLRRFHISHIGMSSFDDYFGVLLMECGNQQRILWANLETSELDDSYLPAGTLQSAFSKFIIEFEKSNFDTN